jgi:modulator of FtsH protease
VTAYDPSEWHDLFVATTGATAALAGLVFVAVSINIERILKFEGLPERALETVVLLLGALLVSIVGLIPGLSHTALGIALLATSLATGATIVCLPMKLGEGIDHVPPAWYLSRWGVRLTGTVPVVIGGVSVLAESGGGLYWIVAGIVFAIVGAVANAWVLLVEILR